MKITKARLKQIIKEELEAVVNEEEEETDEPVEEGFISRDATRGHGSHRDRPGYQRATVAGRVAARGSLLQQAADAVQMSPSDFMMALAKEMDVDLSGQADDPSLPAEGEPPFPPVGE